jgi:hypothetical protein
VVRLVRSSQRAPACNFRQLTLPAASDVFVAPICATSGQQPSFYN